MIRSPVPKEMRSRTPKSIELVRAYPVMRTVGPVVANTAYPDRTASKTMRIRVKVRFTIASRGISSYKVYEMVSPDALHVTTTTLGSDIAPSLSVMSSPSPQL